MGGALLWITTGVQLALAVQGASVRSVAGEEAARLAPAAAALRMSLLWPLQPQLDQHQHPQHGVSNSNKQQGVSPFGRHRARRGAEQPVQDAGEQDQDREEGEAEAGEQPPESGLRRWVIKIRNFMFGRRDLEDTEGGEEQGPPPEGRTWVESLAHWFAHGIKGLLLRMSSSGQEGMPAGMPQQQDEEADSDEEPEEEGEGGGRPKAGGDRLPSNPTPDRRRPKPAPSATTPMRPWTALPPVARTTPPPSAPPTVSATHPPPPATSAEPEKKPEEQERSEEPEKPEEPEEPEDRPEPESEPEDPVSNPNPIPPAAAASGTAVFDDETLARRDHVLEAAKPVTSGSDGMPPAEETNEL